MRWLLILLSLAVGLVACDSQKPVDQGIPEPADQKYPPDSAPHAMLDILFLGDSYTIGEGVAISERWPAQLVRLLREGGLNVADPEIVAHTGWTTDELQDGIQQARLKDTYDLVTLLIGVNNQYRGRDLEEYRQQFRTTLQIAAGFAANNPKRLIIVSIPDWGTTPYANGLDRQRIRAEIDAYNAINREESLSFGAAYVDITPISRRAAEFPDLVAPDGLHPSGAMYAKWVDLILPEAVAALSREGVQGVNP